MKGNVPPEPAMMILSNLSVAEARPWLSVGVLVALLLWESIAPYFRFFSEGGRMKHGIRNFLLGVGNGIVVAVVFVSLWLASATWAREHGFGLLNLAEFPLWARFVIAILLLDLWTYWWHRLNHRVRFFWRFHRVHHSDPSMDVTTANRFHPGEIVFSSLLRIPLIALIGVRLEELVVYEALLFAVVQFHHANISVSERWDRILRFFIVTPFMHKVHHSRWQPETDSNYSSLLSIWDRVFRSFRHREHPEEIHLGLDEFDDTRNQSIGGLVRMPFRKDARESSELSR